MADQKLTDRQSLGTSSDSALVHVVQNGSSYKQTKENLLKEINTRIDENQYTGVIVYDELTDLPATGVLLTSYKVANDTVSSSNNGYYHWSGSAYVKDADLANGVVASGNTDATSGDVVFDAIDVIKATDIKTCYFRGDILTEDGYWKCTSEAIYGISRNGQAFSRTLAETEFASVSTNECIVYKISAGASNPQKVAVTSVDHEDDIILMAYDNVRKWYGGVLVEDLIRGDYGLKVEAFFHRGSLTISKDILTIGVGLYYFINARGVIMYANVGTELVFTLDDANGRYVVFDKSTDDFGYITQQLTINPNDSYTIGYYDTVYGFCGILNEEISKQDSPETALPVLNTTKFLVVADTHGDDVSTYADGADKNIYGGFIKQYDDMCSIAGNTSKDCMIHLGDIIQTPLDDNPTRAVSALQAANRSELMVGSPIYHVSGNHDINYETWIESDMVTFYDNLNDAFISNVQSDNLDEREKLGYYHAIKGNIHIFVLNTNDKDNTRPDAWYDIDATQQTWFQTELNAIADGNHILICSHVNLRTNVAQFAGAEIKDVTIQPATVTAMEGYLVTYLTANKNSRIIGWFSGHTHDNNIENVSISTSGGQDELNYITFTRTPYNQQSNIYNRTNLSFGICSYNILNKNLKINGQGFQDSYDITY